MAAFSAKRFLQTCCSLQRQQCTKTLRIERNRVLRANRQDPAMEKAARNNRLKVSMYEVQQDWYNGIGLKHLIAVGGHFGLYRDMYRTTFQPKTTMEITFDSDQKVHYGNRISPCEAVSRPRVRLPQSDRYLTLALSCPDGHLSSPGKELLHWMRVNIGPEGSPPGEGEEVWPYLQPLPPKGAGLLRYVFTLYAHKHPIRLTSTATQNNQLDNWLESRAFSTEDFMTEHKESEVEPIGFSFFQSEWDHSVHKTFTEDLRCPEPVYKLSFSEPTPASPSSMPSCATL